MFKQPPPPKKILYPSLLKEGDRNFMIDKEYPARNTKVNLFPIKKIYFLSTIMKTYFPVLVLPCTFINALIFYMNLELFAAPTEVFKLSLTLACLLKDS